MSPLDEDQVGQSQGISIRVGHGLYERIKDYSDSSGMSLSKLNRALLEGAVDLLDEGVKDPNLSLVGKLDGVRKRIEITALERTRRTPAKPKSAKAVKELEDKVASLESKLDSILEAVGSK